ncbi:MAG: CCA tRNA nucleotidyltransferase [Anaerolineales bacterium]|nr:CCA tRNA nucleotidyltransferase [Anaerolineales bacterium]
MSELPGLVAELRAALSSAPPYWLVGGAVRDRLLGRRLHDFDFVTVGDGVALARAAAQQLGADFYPLDAERGVGRVLLTRGAERLKLDFARMRGDELAADLAARDFTINAMALDPAAPEALIDPTGGQADLRAKVIRQCGPRSLSDDPVRTIRAVRLAMQLGFRLDPATRAAVRAAAPALPGVAAERRRDEFLRCLGGPNPAGALRNLAVLGLLAGLAPELATNGPGWEHTLASVERLSDLLGALAPVHDLEAASDLTLGLVSVRLGRHRAALGRHLQAPLSDERPAHWLMVLAATLATLDAATARARLTTLRLSTDEVRHVGMLLDGLPALARLAGELPVTNRAIYRYYRAHGAAGVEAALLGLADFLAGFVGAPPTEAWNEWLEAAAALLRAYFETPEEAVNPPALVNGDDLLGELGLKPGPRVGALLEAVREAQAAGEVSDRAGALVLARELAAND